MSGSISDILSSQGFNMSALTSPGSLYGFGAGQRFGSDYDEFFRPFDLEGFQQARIELQNLESDLLQNVSADYRAAQSGLQARTAATQQTIMGQAGRSGLTGGASERAMRLAREQGASQLEDQSRQRESRAMGVQETIGARLGELEGTLFDFLGGAAQTALQIRGFDPTMRGSNQGQLLSADQARAIAETAGLNSAQINDAMTFFGMSALTFEQWSDYLEDEFGDNYDG
jgi:hypothetical protein